MVKQPTCVGLEEMRKGLSHLELLLILLVTKFQKLWVRRPDFW